MNDIPLIPRHELAIRQTNARWAGSCARLDIELPANPVRCTCASVGPCVACVVERVA